MSFNKNIALLICLGISSALTGMTPTKYMRTYPLHVAADKGNLNDIKKWLKQGKNVDAMDKNGETPLMLAAAKGNKDAVQLLLDNGANVDAKDFYGIKTAWDFAKLASEKSGLSQNQITNYNDIMRLVQPTRTQDERSIKKVKIKREDN